MLTTRRPEKDQAKQLYALSALFTKHPEYKTGPKAVHLTLMGGCRDAADEARVTALKKLAAKLDIAVSAWGRELKPRSAPQSDWSRGGEPRNES